MPRNRPPGWPTTSRSLVLPDRLRFTQQLHQAIQHAERNHQQVAIMFVDLDHFKRANDTLEHGARDQPLRMVSGRLSASLRSRWMKSRALDRLMMASQLRRAIDRSEFVLHYQPRVDVVTGRIVGAEALIRWQHPEMSLLTAERLNQMGVRLSIDDFGTGYSSLSYLKRLPIRALKIDHSFVRDLAHDPDDAAIIARARSLKLKVVAEGVETAVQLAFLRARQCDEYQGFLMSRPMVASAFGNMLRQHYPIKRPVAA